jgi:hypothetical protein
MDTQSQSLAAEVASLRGLAQAAGTCVDGGEDWWFYTARAGGRTAMASKARGSPVIVVRLYSGTVKSEQLIGVVPRDSIVHLPVVDTLPVAPGEVRRYRSGREEGIAAGRTAYGQEILALVERAGAACRNRS